ncbi:MAG: hypothetical protein PHE83_02145 [Opitutaceae bacterium]|nr:hypothetical protein [Opitutaceae bacterium]
MHCILFYWKSSPVFSVNQAAKERFETASCGETAGISAGSRAKKSSRMGRQVVGSIAGSLGWTDSGRQLPACENAEGETAKEVTTDAG